MSDKKDFNKKYEKKISSLQIDLVRMQEWVIAEKKKLVIIFSSGDILVINYHFVMVFLTQQT